MRKSSVLAAFSICLVGCSTQGHGVDGESHFSCSSDSECARVNPESRCVHGACVVSQPELDASGQTSALGAGLPMGTLASEQLLPTVIAVGGGSVYWLNLGRLSDPNTKTFAPYTGGTIQKCSVTGCGGEPATVVTNITNYPGRTPFAVQADAVYWGTRVEDGSSYIVSCGTGGCLTPIRFSVFAQASALVTDAANLYWTTGETGLSGCALSDCVPRTLSAESNTGDAGNDRLVADDTDVYWINGRDILKCDKRGCGTASPAVPQSALTSKSQPFDIAVDDQYIYWTTIDVSRSLASSVADIGQIMKCEKSGCSTPVVIVDRLYGPTSITTDGTNVYWSENAEESCCSGTASCCDGRTDVGRIAKCPIAGCDQPVPVVPHLSAASNLAVDGFNVYFTTLDADRQSGTVIRAPK